MKSHPLLAELRTHADPAIAAHSHRFFRAEPGGYGEGDRFLGIRVPVVRQVARGGRDLSLANIASILRSEWHEERLLALVLMVERFKKTDAAKRHALHDAYIAHLPHVNNWDLVDISAPWLVGTHLLRSDRSLIYELAHSGELWPQRTAMMATFAFIRAGEFEDTLAVADILLQHEHDLIHKAVGWMLREVGNRDNRAEEAFLKEHHPSMPRTMLRYAIEKFPEPRRRAYLEGRP